MRREENEKYNKKANDDEAIKRGPQLYHFDSHTDFFCLLPVDYLLFAQSRLPPTE
jgi:hypothetical protein